MKTTTQTVSDRPVDFAKMDRIAARLTQEARALVPELGDAVEVRTFGGGLSLWHGNAVWGLSADEDAARVEMAKIISLNPQF